MGAVFFSFFFHSFPNPGGGVVVDNELLIHRDRYPTCTPAGTLYKSGVKVNKRKFVKGPRVCV